MKRYKGVLFGKDWKVINILKSISKFLEKTPSHALTPPPRPIAEWHDGQRRLVSWETVLAQRACAR